MRKKVIRFFGGLILTQQKWLNKMAQQGYRLVSPGKLIYEFEECEPDKYQYCVDFVAEKSSAELAKYKAFLSEMGYDVFSKNINLNWSLGKVTFRPYGKGLGMLATSPGTYNKELLIVGKLNDGKEFELHTSISDRMLFYKKQRDACLTIFALAIIMLINNAVRFGNINIIALIFAVLSAVPTMLFEIKLLKAKRESTIIE